LDTGAVVQKIDIAAQYFGEGIVNWGNHLISLTWQSHVGFVFALTSLKLQKEFHYDGEGWALTQDGKQLIMSDGTPNLRFLNPDTLAPTGRLQVTFDNKPVRNVNELEWVKGEIYANVWETNWILRIDPKTGDVVGLIDLAGILSPSEHTSGPDSVLNGIAYELAQAVRNTAAQLRPVRRALRRRRLRRQIVHGTRKFKGAHQHVAIAAHRMGRLRAKAARFDPIG
jgi:glutaminyl-peptide cyclotransferase